LTLPLISFFSKASAILGLFREALRYCGGAKELVSGFRGYFPARLFL
jgi:hypothetical protein